MASLLRIDRFSVGASSKTNLLAPTGKKMTNNNSGIRDGDDAPRPAHQEAPGQGGHSGHRHGPPSPVAHTDHEAHTGHDRHTGHSAEMFRRKFWGTLLL